MYRLIVAGDLLPSGNNIPLFMSGDSESIFGTKVLQLFKNADSSIINLEGALTDTDSPIDKVGPILKAPKSCINGLKNLGIQSVALANNHMMDYGIGGYRDTIDVLDKAGIRHLGAGENINSITTNYIIDTGQKIICIYNVSETFFNVATQSTPGANIYDEYVVCDELKKLKENCDYLIVIYHGGAEEFPYPTPQTRQRFHRMAESGADFITAQHTHCIGCAEWYKGSYLLYGQGNFLFARMKDEVTKSGLITEIVFDNDCTHIHQHIVNVSNDDLMTYSNNQDLSDFDRRSNEVISNFNEVVDKYYQHLYYNKQMKTRWLSAFKGNTFESRLLRRLCPAYYKNKFLEQYNRQQILCIKSVLFGDRYSEDAEAMCNYMISQKRI